MTARSLLIGLDGAELSLITQLGRARLPHLHALMDRGMFAACQSVMPPATLPNWTTLLTGVNPGAHGVFDFTTRQGYAVRFTAGSVREVPTIMTRLDRQGLRCACIGFPATWPPEQLEHGIFISGWDAPVAFESDASFVWPPALHHELLRRFGPTRFDDVDELNADQPGWHDRLPHALCARIDHKVELATHLLDSRAWDLFAFYFGESDTAAHHLWALHDPASPRHPDHHRAHAGLALVYERLDAAVGALVQRAGGDAVEVTIISDHGSGGASDKVLYLNRVLAQTGFLTFAPVRSAIDATQWLKHTALTRLPPRLRERVFRLAGSTLPGWLESRARFGHIDMRHTRAFSEELNYFPSICWNLRGREPDGVLDARDVKHVQRDLTAALLALRDPWSGQPVVAAVHTREELFRGPFVKRAPDLLLDLRLDAGYSYNLMPSPSDSDAHALPFRRLLAHEHLGRKGRSLAGSHRPLGTFIAAGPSVNAVGERQARMADVTATLLFRMARRGDDPKLSDVIIAHELIDAHTHDEARPHVSGDQALVESRLRALGYID